MVTLEGRESSKEVRGVGSMGKHLIYLGYTGTAHRIALFDEDHILTRKVQVKDVPVLTDDLKLLNCTVVEGYPIPNLMGAKVLRSVPWYYKSPLSLEERWSMKEQDLWAFTDVAPAYLYDWNKYSGLSVGELLRDFYGFAFWDGLCKPNYFYILGVIVVAKTFECPAPIGSLLCMDCEGSLFFMSRRALRTLDRAGAVFVQVGTPELYCPNACDSMGACIGRYATIRLPRTEVNKVLWDSAASWQSIKAEKVEYVWGCEQTRKTICDLRKYSSARVFGIGSCAPDTRVVIFPESAKEIWMGMFADCPNLRAVYIPAGVEDIHEIGYPNWGLNTGNAVFYSRSPLVAEYCQRHEFAYSPCDQIDALMSELYSISADEYLVPYIVHK